MTLTHSVLMQLRNFSFIFNFQFSIEEVAPKSAELTRLAYALSALETYLSLMGLKAFAPLAVSSALRFANSESVMF